MTKKPLYKKRTLELVSNKRRVNLVDPNSKFGYWTVIGKGKKRDYLLCRCKCGVEREVHVYSLTSGKSESCGCKRKQKAE